MSKVTKKEAAAHEAAPPVDTGVLVPFVPDPPPCHPLNKASVILACPCGHSYGPNQALYAEPKKEEPVAG